jgi:hypothetical protein
MSVRRALLFAALGLAGLALLLGTGLRFLLPHASTASLTKHQISATDRMRSVLTPLSQQPPGTSIQEMDLKQASAAHMFDIPTGYTFSPPACLEYLVDVIGDPGKYAGWVQIGTLPTDSNGANGQFSAMAVSVPGGLDLSKVQTSAAACSAGRMTVPKLKVNATVKLAHYAVRSLPNAQTLGLTVTTSFDAGTSAAQRAAAIGACAAPEKPVVSTEVVSYSCAAAAKKEMAKATADRRYLAYLSYGNVLYEACSSSVVGADEMLTSAYQHARSVMGD